MDFNIFGKDRPPAPEVATAEDVEQYNLEYARSEGIVPEFSNRRANGDSETIVDKDTDTDPDRVKHKSEFPWLFDPSRGVRWDFDPVALRNISQTNTWVNMLISTITKEIAETPWTITKSDGRVETQKRLATHPEERDTVQKELPDRTAEEIYDTLMHPNPDDTWHDLVEQWYADLLEIGSMTGVKSFHRRAYDGDEFVGDPRQFKPRMLKATAPEVWTKDYNKAGFLEGYWQFEDRSAPGSGSPDGTQTSVRGIRDPTPYDKTEVIWDDMNPRSNRRYGIPPTLAVQQFLESADLAIGQEQEYLSRGSLPSGAAVFEEWDREELREWNEQHQENIKGKPWKWLTIAGKGGDFSFEPFSYNFDEMQFTERMKWYARVIASVFQVPTAVVGIEPERVNYTTFQGERQNFESNTLGPYLQQGERWITHNFIRPHWGPNYRFEFKPGMSETTRGMISDRVRKEFNAGIRRRNEARRELGLDEVEDDFNGFQDEVVEDTSPADAEDRLGDLVQSKATGAAVAFPNAGGPAFESRTTLIEFCDDLAEICDGGVFIGDNEYPEELTGDLDGQPVRAVGVGERKAYAVWSRYRDEAVALSDPHTVDSADIEQATAKQDGPFTDYPDAAVENAQMALDAKEDTGDPNDCGTDTGWARANQLADREPISEETVRRMAAFRRHQDNAEQEDEEGRADCGWMMWKAWGGEEGIAWAERKVEQWDEEEEAEQSAGDSGNGNLRKDEPLRNTDEWYNFSVQPSDIEPLADEIAGDVDELFERVVDDDEVRQIIDRLAGDETDKSLAALSRRLREIFSESEIVARIESALRDGTADMVEESISDALADADADATADVDIDAIREQLSNRSVEFADSFANDLSEDIRDTVGDGWAEGQSSREIAEEISQQADINEDWTGAERIARQEMHVAAASARNEVAAELDKVEVWQDSQDNRVRDAHAEMSGSWKRPSENWQVEYEDNVVVEEAVPGDSERGIGCRCQTLLRDIESVDVSNHAGV